VLAIWLILTGLMQLDDAAVLRIETCSTYPGKGAYKMSYITWLFAGAVIGCLTTIVIRRRRSILPFNIIVGMIGAFVAGFFLPLVFHIRQINQGTFNLSVLMVSMGGAVILLVVVNFFRRENDVKNDVIEREWVKVRNKIHARWGKITEEDVDEINGNYNQFIITLQARYGFAKDEAEDQIQRYLKADDLML
jgi:uncharacterized membrane protein YeaQ/YmgE (transglycosylase-associated protein family)/uncharacterized protein YjbJ (UPF0337 family)